MTIQIDFPEEVEQDIQGLHSEEYDRKLKELTAIEAYRQRKIGTAGVRQMLGFANRWQTINFLSAHGVYPNYDLEDLEQDRASIARVEGLNAV